MYFYALAQESSRGSCNFCRHFLYNHYLILSLSDLHVFSIRSRKEKIERDSSILHSLPQIYFPLKLGGGHEMYYNIFPSCISATYQIWWRLPSSSCDKDTYGMTDNDGPKPIEIGNLSDSGDLKNSVFDCNCFFNDTTSTLFKFHNLMKCSYSENSTEK